MRTRTSPFSVNLKAFASRFFRIWRNRCGSVTMLCGTSGATSIEKPRARSLRDVLELAEQRVAKVVDDGGGQVGDDRARLGLREIEDVVEQLEQVATRCEDHARVFDLPVGHRLVRVVLELLGKDQQAVQRRAQLVRHVRDELRLVLRRDRELAGLLLDQLLGLLDLVVASLRLDVLLCEQFRLAPEVLVRLTQLLLLGAKLLGL